MFWDVTAPREFVLRLLPFIQEWNLLEQGASWASLEGPDKEDSILGPGLVGLRN